MKIGVVDIGLLAIAVIGVVISIAESMYILTGITLILSANKVFEIINKIVYARREDLFQAFIKEYNLEAVFENFKRNRQ